MEIYMKNLLTKILFVSLLFSAAISAGIQRKLTNWNILRNRANVNINMQTYGGQRALIHAIEKNNPERVKLLLANGADATKKDCWNWTPLMSAVQNEKNARDTVKKKEANDIIDMVLAASTNVLIKTKNGTSVLHQSNNPKIRKLMQQQTTQILNKELSEKEKLKNLDIANISQLIAKFTY